MRYLNLGSELKSRKFTGSDWSADFADPTYMIRAIPSNASDNVYCTLLAHSAIHGAMAGYTGCIAGPVNGRHAYIPLYVSSRIHPPPHPGGGLINQLPRSPSKCSKEILMISSRHL